jgi:hypothetical protein
MPERWNAYRPSLLDRVARVAFTFVVMNCSAVMGVLAALGKRKVWH